MVKEEGVVQNVKVERVLVTVEFMTWLPAEARDLRRGEIDVNAKVEMRTTLWAPFPVGKDGQPDPSLLPPHEQGILWAINKVIQMRPDGREVLAITGIKTSGLVESTIANQPKVTIVQDTELPGADITDILSGKRPLKL